MNYLTRMSQKIGAVVKPVDDHLVVAKNMSGLSVSGENLPTKYLDASEVASYSCDFRETESGGFCNRLERKTGFATSLT